MDIGVIGLGEIATAVVESLVNQGHRLRVSERSAHNAGRLAECYSEVSVAANQRVVDDSEVVFIGLIETAAADVLGALQFKQGQQVVSLMARLSAPQVAGLVAPAQLAARMIPFPTIAKGGSAILSYGDTDLVESLFGSRNQVFSVADEDELQAYLCAQAVLSPAVNLVGEAASWLSQQTSDPESAERFLRILVGTSLLDASCDALLQSLDTPGGYNQRLRRHLQEAGLNSHLRQGLDNLQGG